MCGMLCSFEFRLRVALGPGGDLMLTSRIRNTDSKPFHFTFAYHTYFSVSDIRCVNEFLMCVVNACWQYVFLCLMMENGFIWSKKVLFLFQWHNSIQYDGDHCNGATFLILNIDTILFHWHVTGVWFTSMSGSIQSSLGPLETNHCIE